MRVRLSELRAMSEWLHGATEEAEEGESGQSVALTCTLLLCAVAAASYYLTRPAKRQRAGTVPMRVSPSGRLSVMLIESRRHADRWTLPAGGVERGERAEQAALRETKEEAGLVGQLGRRVCSVSDAKSYTTMWALYVTSELETYAHRPRRTDARHNPTLHSCLTATRHLPRVSSAGGTRTLSDSDAGLTWE